MLTRYINRLNKRYECVSFTMLYMRVIKIMITMIVIPKTFKQFMYIRIWKYVVSKCVSGFQAMARTFVTFGESRFQKQQSRVWNNKINMRWVANTLDPIIHARFCLFHYDYLLFIFAVGSVSSYHRALSCHSGLRCSNDEFHNLSINVTGTNCFDVIVNSVFAFILTSLGFYFLELTRQVL